MTAFADITINDGKATPVAHTFKVKLNDNMVSLWEDRVNGVPLGYALVRLTTKDTASVRKINVAITVPTLEAVSGANPAGFTPAPRVAYTHRFNGEFIMPQRGSTAERVDLLAYAKNFLALSLSTAVITTGEEITG